MNFGMITLNQNMETEQCYTDTDSFLIYVMAEDYFKHSAGDVKR